MEKKDLYQLTDEELVVEKKKLNKSKIFNAASIGFLGGILIFGIVFWSLSSDKHVGFFIPMLTQVPQNRYVVATNGVISDSFRQNLLFPRMFPWQVGLGSIVAQ